jgi:hypothetical protein
MQVLSDLVFAFVTRLLRELELQSLLSEYRTLALKELATKARSGFDFHVCWLFKRGIFLDFT